jgi:hypothetical protein
METRGLLVATATLAALGGLVWWTNKNPSKPEGISDAKREQLVTLAQSDLVEVTVARRGEAPLVLRKDAASGNWQMVVDPPLATDAQQAMDVVTNVATISSDQLVEENATDLAQYGLEPALFTLTLKDKAGKTQQLLVGDESPVGYKYYARRPNEKKVYAIAQYFKVGFDKRVADLQDKRLLVVDEAKLARVEVTRGGTVLEFGKNGQGLWQLVKPQPYRTNATVVDDLLTKVREAVYDPLTLPTVKQQQAAKFASAAPVATLTLTDAAGAKTLEVRKTKEGDYLGKSATVAGVHKVEAALGDALAKPLEEYRSKKLMDFGYDDPARIEWRKDGKTTTLEHKGEDWLLNGAKTDRATVTGFLEQLRGLSALGFVEGKYTTAALSITVTQRDGKTVEKLEVAEVGKFRYARREGEAGQYELDPKTLTDLEAELGRVKVKK